MPDPQATGSRAACGRCGIPKGGHVHSQAGIICSDGGHYEPQATPERDGVGSGRRIVVGQRPERVQGVSNEAADELWRAINKFGPMASPHEGWAVIHEEMDELWTHVKENTGRSDLARAEAIQIAAMALRYVADLCDGHSVDTNQFESGSGSQDA